MCIDPLNLILTLVRCNYHHFRESERRDWPRAWDFTLVVRDLSLIWVNGCWSSSFDCLSQWIKFTAHAWHIQQKRLIYPTCIHLLGSVISSFLEGHYFCLPTKFAERHCSSEIYIYIPYTTRRQRKFLTDVLN